MSRDHLLTAEPNAVELVISRRYESDGEIEVAAADGNGVLRDEQGRSYSAGAYSIMVDPIDDSN